MAKSEQPFDDILQSENTHEAATTWTNLLLDTIKEYIPNICIKVSPKDKPWITKHVKQGINKRPLSLKAPLLSK